MKGSFGFGGSDESGHPAPPHRRPPDAPTIMLRRRKSYVTVESREAAAVAFRAKYARWLKETAN